MSYILSSFVPSNPIVQFWSSFLLNTADFYLFVRSGDSISLRDRRDGVAFPRLLHSEAAVYCIAQEMKESGEGELLFLRCPVAVLSWRFLF